MDIKEELKSIAKSHDMSLSEMIEELRSIKRKDEELQYKEDVKKNEELIGKCFYELTEPRSGMFPQMKRFYKVISNRSSYSNRIECLVFDAHPTYWFEYQFHLKGMSGDYFFGDFEFESFHTEDVLVNELNHMIEISQKKFDEAAKKYLDELLDTKWYADHYRYGGVLPTDPKWPKKDI